MSFTARYRRMAASSPWPSRSTSALTSRTSPTCRLTGNRPESSSGRTFPIHTARTSPRASRPTGTPSRADQGARPPTPGLGGVPPVRLGLRLALGLEHVCLGLRPVRFPSGQGDARRKPTHDQHTLDTLGGRIGPRPASGDLVIQHVGLRWAPPATGCGRRNVHASAGITRYRFRGLRLVSGRRGGDTGRHREVRLTDRRRSLSVKSWAGAAGAWRTGTTIWPARGTRRPRHQDPAPPGHGHRPGARHPGRTKRPRRSVAEPGPREPLPGRGPRSSWRTGRTFASRPPAPGPPARVPRAGGPLAGGRARRADRQPGPLPPARRTAGLGLGGAALRRALRAELGHRRPGRPAPARPLVGRRARRRLLLVNPLHAAAPAAPQQPSPYYPTQPPLPQSPLPARRGRPRARGAGDAVAAAGRGRAGPQPPSGGSTATRCGASRRRRWRRSGARTRATPAFDRAAAGRRAAR